jgi:S-(hydroxymethyl)glutathione dehydrogenase/alcohol dehydrogenase
MVIEEVAVDAPGPREVLIRTSAAGVCHSDLSLANGLPGFVAPIVCGHESAGVVEAVGAEVAYVQPGDHVITSASVFCGECRYCLSGHPNICDRIGVDDRPPADPPRLTIAGARCGQFVGLGSFAEQLLVHEHSVVKIRQDMPLDRAALIGCGVTTGLGAVFRAARLEGGSTAAVIGCGGVGLNCIQGAVLAGASRVVAIDISPAKLDLAKEFGATDVIDASVAEPVEMVRNLFPGVGRLGYAPGGVDYSFEAIGTKTTVEQAFAMLRKGGTATVIGVMPSGVKVEFDGLEFLTEKKIQGTLTGSNQFRVDMPRYVELYMQGRLKLDELISARIRLDDLHQGFEAMERGDVARSVVVFD